MAVKTVCPRCQKSFSAQEDIVGKKVRCPSCGHRYLLRSIEELREIEAVEKARQKKQHEDQRRIELIERMDIRRKRESRPYYETYGTGQSPVRHFNPGAPSRYLRLRALSELCLLFAYLEVVFVLMGMGLTVYCTLEGLIASVPLLVLCLVGWVIVGSVLYVVLKFLAELAFVLSDIGDQQRDETQLLLDLRENTDQLSEKEA